MTCAGLLSERHGVEWLLLTDERAARGLSSMWPSGLAAIGLKVNEVLVRKALPGGIGRQFWVHWQLPSVLRRWRPDLLMTTGGIFTSHTPCPQCAWMTVPAPALTTSNARNHLRGANALFTFSEKEKWRLIEKDPDKAPGAKERIFVIRPAADPSFQPLAPAEREKEKSDHANGMEYFLAVISGASPEELIGLLKAFSLFKKRQRSNLQLILTGADATGRLSSTGRIDSYVYRSSVHAIDDPSGGLLPRLMAAAYAYVSPFGRDTAGADLLNAWATGTPVIAAMDGPSQELGPDAILPMDPREPASLAAQLMRVFTNEEERSALVRKAAARLRSYDRDRTAGCLWEGILRAKG
ncbi:MAG: glycosyltransferase [Bacteroidota bacterium]|nr:glycosyltransferase [Bacteroidota bacterium]